MKNDKLIPGMILVMIGAIFLLHNFGYIHFHWGNIWRLWPVFLVMGGINLVFANNHSAWATILKITVVLACFAVLVFANFSDDGNWRWWKHTYHYNSSVNNDGDDNNNDSDDNDDDDNMKTTSASGSNEFNEPYNASVKFAKLIINGGATTFRLNDTTSQLFKANTKQFHGSYSFTTHKEDSLYVMDLSLKEKKFWNWGDDNKDNNATISLNTKPVWDMEVNAGATDLDFDMSKYKVRSFILKGGAGAFKIRMGDPLANSDITVETGASDVTINIPKDAACSVETSSGLSSNDFQGLSKKDDGHYETANYGSAKNKYDIHISGGVSDFKVHTY
jgi:cell wall-active antibiotic response 4TMS protein YvqF